MPWCGRGHDERLVQSHRRQFHLHTHLHYRLFLCHAKSQHTEVDYFWNPLWDLHWFFGHHRGNQCAKWRFAEAVLSLGGSQFPSGRGHYMGYHLLADSLCAGSGSRHKPSKITNEALQRRNGNTQYWESLAFACHHVSCHQCCEYLWSNRFYLSRCS